MWIRVAAECASEKANEVDLAKWFDKLRWPWTADTNVLVMNLCVQSLPWWGDHKQYINIYYITDIYIYIITYIHGIYIYTVVYLSSIWFWGTRTSFCICRECILPTLCDLQALQLGHHHHHHTSVSAAALRFQSLGQRLGRQNANESTGEEWTSCLAAIQLSKYSCRMSLLQICVQQKLSNSTHLNSMKNNGSTFLDYFPSPV